MTYPLIADEWSPIGWPDRFVAHERWTGFFEAKGFRGTVTSEQVQVLTLLHKRGVNVFLLRFSEDWFRVRLTTYDGRSSRWGRWSEFFELCEEMKNEDGS
jgi:hypothetical protein